ncbi:MAG: sterol desaturase family protein [Elusimicrobiota bacterium]
MAAYLGGARDFFFDGVAAFRHYVLRILSYPLNPHERIFALYLATSLLMAVAAHRSLVRRAARSGRPAVALGEFLFPREVWRTRSAWLDVRYFFFHQVFRIFLYGGFTAFVTGGSFRAIEKIFGGSLSAARVPSLDVAWPVLLGFSLFAALAYDFTAWVIHYCQHKFPPLWEFHKVHHSARVMHPLTNYREHPVDNIAYALGMGLCTAATTAVASVLLGYVPNQPAVMGIGIFVFAYNALGYNLRHSHIWVKWPGPLNRVFGSPAHHQVHHSYHPAHVNKNFAFMFPVWDVLFGTYEMPATNADVAFGLAEREEYEFTSCLDLYFTPFRRVFRREGGERSGAPLI